MLPNRYQLSSTSINENVSANSTVGTLSTTDSNSSDSFTYTLVAGTGDTDNNAFGISGSLLTINSSPDYEAKSSYSIRIRSTDLGGLYTDKQFTIQVNDLSESTTTTITSDAPDPSVVGQNYTVSVSVAPSSGAGMPSGSVQIGDSVNFCTATLSAGTGSCSLPSTSAGTKTITANYSGSTGWLTSSDTESHSVTKADTTTTITSITPEPSELGGDYTIYMTVTTNSPSTSLISSGTINVTVGTTTTGVPITDGQASLLVTGNSTGTVTIFATYLGDASHFNTSSDTETMRWKIHSSRR